jgi:predicted nucleic acid-binding protein
VSGAISAFAGLARVRLEEPTAVAQALAWVGAGLDFADALHLAKARACEAFVTFDRLLAKQANRVRTISVRAP